MGTQSVNDMFPHNSEDVDLSDLVMKKVYIDRPGNLLLPARENGSIFDVNTSLAIGLRPRLSCIMKLKLNQMDDQSTFLNRNLNVKVEDLPFVIMVKNIMKILSKSCDEATHEKNHKGNENIDFVDNMNKEVHDRSKLVNEGVDICNLPLLYRILC